MNVSMREVMEQVSSEFLLVTFSSSMGRRTKTDRRATDKLTSEAGAKKGSAKAVKDLFFQASEEIDAIAAAISVARREHMELTAAFSSADKKGARLISNVDFMQLYAKAMSKGKTEVQKCLSTLEPVFDYRVQMAMANLAGLSCPSDYPTFEEFASQCSIGFEVEVVPRAQDWERNSLALTQSVGDKFQSHTQNAIERKIECAVRDTVERLEIPLRALIKTTTATDGKYPRFFDTAVTNMADVCSALKRFNLFKDPQIDAIVNRIETDIACYTPGQVRSSESIKEDIHETAQEVQTLLDATSWMQAA